MSKIQIVGNPNNENRPFTTKEGQEEGKEFTTLRIEKETFNFNGTIGNQVKRVAFLRIPLVAMASFCQYAGVPHLATNTPIEKPVATTLKGVLQVQESFDPFYAGQNPKINPTSGEVVQKDGKDVYRNTIFVSDEGASEYLFGQVVVNEAGRYVFSSNTTTSEPVPATEPLTA
jgi:hypothetical protein